MNLYPITVKMTPEVRELALTHLRLAELDPELDKDVLLCWFEEADTPDGTVLDAGTAQADAEMIHVIATAVMYRYWRESHELDDSDRRAEEAVRTISRY